MDNKEFLNISEQNSCVAKWAKEQKYYNVSISRYYYALFQKILYIIKTYNINCNWDENKDSHYVTIKAVIEYFRLEKKFKVAGSLQKLQSLRHKRNEADYIKRQFLEEDMNNFIKEYNNINNHLNNELKRR